LETWVLQRMAEKVRSTEDSDKFGCKTLWNAARRAAHFLMQSGKGM
jgi:hypothetical protein